MALKLVSIIALLTLVEVSKAYDDGCICDDVQIKKERDEVFKFLGKLQEAGEDEPSIPGFLGPLVQCGNCIEYTRKKRTVLPEVPSPGAESAVPATRMRVTTGWHGNRCPSGYIRIAFTCVPTDFDY